MSENYTGLHINWIEQWSQFFQSCNWYTFHPIRIELENDVCMGGYELTLVVMGLGVCLRYNHSRTEEVERISEFVEMLERDDPEHALTKGLQG